MLQGLLPALAAVALLAGRRPRRPVTRGVCLQGEVRFLDGSVAAYGSSFCTLNP